MLAVFTIFGYGLFARRRLLHEGQTDAIKIFGLTRFTRALNLVVTVQILSLRRV